MDLAYHSTGLAYFGPSFDTKSRPIFRGFDEKVWKVAAGYPPALLRDFIDAREKMVDIFKQYLKAPHEAGELVSGMEHYGNEGGLDERDVGVLMLCSWWPLMANAPWATL